jgi:uridine phosphorylase
MKKDIQDANFPKDASGAPYHIQTTNVASRILTVGELTRARKICTLLTQVEEISGTRGFTVINGLYKGIKVSIISIGMIICDWLQFS